MTVDSSRALPESLCVIQAPHPMLSSAAEAKRLSLVQSPRSPGISHSWWCCNRWDALRSPTLPC